MSILNIASLNDTGKLFQLIIGHIFLGRITN